MHEVMEHVGIRIGSRDIRATVFATIHTPHDSTHPRGVRNKELVELGPEGDPAPTLPLLDRDRRAHGGRDSGGKQMRVCVAVRVHVRAYLSTYTCARTVYSSVPW